MRQLSSAVLMVAVFTVLTGFLFPLVVTGMARVLFPRQAGGSLIRQGERVVGSDLIGQGFAAPGYFHPRPSAAGSGYDAANSGGTNLGPTNARLIADVRALAVAYRQENGLPANASVPPDAVTRSGSGLDPHISPANAALQADRVARARGLPEGTVRGLVAQYTEGRQAGFLGEPRVNVLRLNLALDAGGQRR